MVGILLKQPNSSTLQHPESTKSGVCLSQQNKLASDFSCKSKGKSLLTNAHKDRGTQKETLRKVVQYYAVCIAPLRLYACIQYINTRAILFYSCSFAPVELTISDSTRPLLLQFFRERVAIFLPHQESQTNDLLIPVAIG